MGFHDAVSYVLFTNPISSGTASYASSAVSAAANYVGLTPKTEVIMAPVTPLWKLTAMAGSYMKLAAISGATAVILGAYGAHSKPLYPIQTIMTTMLAILSYQLINIASLAPDIGLRFYWPRIDQICILMVLEKYDHPDQRRIFETANRFHFYHSLALMGVSFCRAPGWASTFFVAAMLMFCGTCYYSAFTGDPRFNKITPIGGVCFIIGWLSMCI